MITLPVPMKISFVIPAYNEEHLIGKCIESIQRELAHGAYDAEIIIVNNASADRTKEISLSFSDVQVVDEARKGVRFARHVGFLASTGELVANIDADNMLPPGWLAKVMEEFTKTPKIVGLSGPYRFYDLPLSGRMLTRFLEVFGFAYYLFMHFIHGADGMICGGNLIVRREALEAIGGFNTDVSSAADDNYTLLCLEKIGIVKWSWPLYINASGRRLKENGIIMQNLQWVMNVFAMRKSGKQVFSTEYGDVREN